MEWVSISIKREEFRNLIYKKDEKNRIDAALVKLGPFLKPNLTTNEKQLARNCIFRLKLQFQAKWKAAHNKLDSFNDAENEWLASDIRVPLCITLNSSTIRNTSTLISNPTSLPCPSTHAMNTTVAPISLPTALTPQGNGIGHYSTFH